MTSFRKALHERRAGTGMDESSAGFLLGLSVAEYSDLEAYDDEWKTLTPLYVVLSACRLFNIDLMESVPAQAGVAVSRICQPGEIIKERRVELGLSGPEFAERCGFFEPFTGTVETGEGIIIYPFLVTTDICRVLGLDLASFVSKTLRPPTWPGKRSITIKLG